MSYRYLAVWFSALAFLAIGMPASGQEEWGRSKTDPEWARLPAILSLEPVRKDLGLSGEQRDALTRLLRDLEPQKVPAHEALRTIDEARILGPEQLNRLQQIRWQCLGALAVFDDEMARRLELTDAQRERLAKLRTAEDVRLEDELSRIRFESSVDEKRFIINFWRNDRAILGVLTKEQRERLEQSLGKIHPRIAELVARSS
jgi:hypothetical protein